MLTKLAEYYQAHGISARDFHCPSLAVCKNGNERFVEAKAAFVGTEYEKGSLPRLVFVSLDPATSRPDAEARSLAYERHAVEELCDVLALPKARHWYRTHELAWVLLREIKPDLQIQDSRLYFSHVNTAKCCVSNDNHKSARSVLFTNCRKYIRGEIEILRPDVLVTQGKWAKIAVEQSFEVPPGAMKDLCSGIQLIIGERSVLWFHTYHPRNFGKFNQQRRTCFEKWAKIVFNEFSDRNKKSSNRFDRNTDKNNSVPSSRKGIVNENRY